MSTEIDFEKFGPFTLAVGESAWHPITSANFDSDHWQKLSVFPTGRNFIFPVKVTIVQEDWEIDENQAHVCWVLVRNSGPNTLEFTITASTTPNR